MSGLQAVTEGLTRIERVVPKIEDRSDRSRPEEAFPQLPGEKKREEPEPEADRPPTRHPAEDEEHRIDIHVMGRILPTRQSFPQAPPSSSIH